MEPAWPSQVTRASLTRDFPEPAHQRELSRGVDFMVKIDVFYIDVYFSP